MVDVRKPKYSDSPTMVEKKKCSEDIATVKEKKWSSHSKLMPLVAVTSRKYL